MEHEAVILICRRLEKDLLSACRLRLPYETCGIIYGTESDKLITADGYHVIRNASPSQADSFSFPQGTILPSRLDEQGSIPWESYWIISFAEGNNEIAVYNRVTPQQWVSLSIKRIP
jgi:proteasome lid subunit RPN8/RPN11